MLNRALATLLTGLVVWVLYDQWFSRREASAARPAAAVPAASPVRELAVRSYSGDLPKRGQWRGHPVLADLDGDGNNDLIAALRRWERDEPGEGIHVWLGDGKGGWKARNEGLPRDMGYGGAEVGDIDADGRLDIAYSGHDLPPAVFMNMLGTGATDAFATTREGIDCRVMCLDVALGDCNRDGALDLAAIGLFPKRGGLYVWAGNGLGTFRRLAELLSPSHYGADVRFVDLEGDGVQELIAATDTGPRVWSYDPNRGFIDHSEGLPRGILGGQHSGRANMPSASHHVGGADLAVAARDFDGDGVQELVTAGLVYPGHPGLQIFRRQPDGTWRTWGSGLPASDNWYDLTLARLHLSSRPVLVAAGKKGVYLIDVTPTGESKVLGHVADTVETLNVTAGDVDADGRDEIVCVGFNGISVVGLSETNADLVKEERPRGQ
jgi:hypothetical protein